MNKILQTEDFLEVGFLSGLTGFSGQIKLGLEEELEAYFLSDITFFYCVESGMYVPYFVENITEKGGHYLVKIEELDSREVAVDLTNQAIYLRKNQLPSELLELLERKLFIQNIEDYSIFDIASQMNIGQIKEILSYPAGPMAQVQLNHSPRLVLIPLVDSFVKELQHEDKVLVMDLPGGLWSLDEEE